MAAAKSTEPVGTERLLLTGEGSELVARRWRIEVEAGPDRGKQLIAESGTIVAGSHPDADLVLTDGTVSRYHAELRLLPEGVLVVDLGSTNGTRVGGARVERCLVSPGGCFRLGHTQVRAHAEDRAVEPARVDAAASGPLATLGTFVTGHAQLARTLGQLERVAKTEASVLIQGETGTGKEILARAIHEASHRSSGPFVVVDCGAVHAQLLESQLFGHKKGAFTGAASDHAGAFEAARGGTVLLDELGELPIDLQPKLLRVLEARTIRRLGEVSDRPIDVRFVAATHRDLDAMRKERAFRDDLFFRVAVVRALIPPLRERAMDIGLVARRYVEDLSGGRATLSQPAVAALSQYDWPGNARELRNVIQRALALSDAAVIGPDELFPDRSGSDQPFHAAKERVIAEFEIRYVRTLLEKHDGNVSRAAKEAGLSRNALYALMKRAGLE
ncbi:MAG: sigma 54-dependent Fis family transcriptional regulator [Deltaproteobacteria bacterium]|nr:sigma 54-dependent Fis family transcriptional regulator [Deltaproteobacteria bacterium]